jgi:hypothetical protein
MKEPDKTNVSQALFLAQLASDGRVTNGNQDDLSALPEEFSGLYRACYEAGHAGGWEAGYRQGYEAGFGDGRRQGDAGSTAAPAAVENNTGNSESENGGAGNGASGRRKARLFGLPCTNCGSFFYSDEAQCPRCQTPRVSTAKHQPPS